MDDWYPGGSTLEEKKMDEEDIRKAIVRYYNEKTSEEIERIISEMDSEEANDRFGWCEDVKLREALVWCEYEEFPELVAKTVRNAEIDIYDLFIDLRHDRLLEEKEAQEDYEELQREYREIQGWHP